MRFSTVRGFNLLSSLLPVSSANNLIIPTLSLYYPITICARDLKALEELKAASAKHGGVSEVLNAINAYANVQDIETAISRLEKKKAEAEAELKRVNVENVHLQTVIAICDTLLYTYKFSVPAIGDIYELAKKYGEPLEVLKAVAKYGELNALEHEVEMLAARAQVRPCARLRRG